MTPDQALCDLVRRLVGRMIDQRDGNYPKSNTLRRAWKTGNISVRSLARIADSLGYEVVMMVRKK